MLKIEQKKLDEVLKDPAQRKKLAEALRKEASAVEAPPGTVHPEGVCVIAGCIVAGLF